MDAPHSMVHVLCALILSAAAGLAQVDLSGIRQAGQENTERARQYKRDSNSSASALTAPEFAKVEAHAANTRGLEVYEKGGWEAAYPHFEEAWRLEPTNETYRKNFEQARTARLNAQIDAATQKGLTAWNNAQWAEAEVAFQTAVNLDPESETLRRNLLLAREKAAQDKAAQANRQRASASVATMQVTVNRHLTELATRVDFDRTQQSGAPEPTPKFLRLSEAGGPVDEHRSFFSDPLVVDARNLPSRLPLDLQRAIAGAYANGPLELRLRVEKGFLAVIDHDWNLAAAVFREALDRDPGNPGLQQFFTLAQEAAAESGTSNRKETLLERLRQHFAPPKPPSQSAAGRG